MNALAVYCADVGSIAKGNFGWACGRSGDPNTVLETGDGIDELARLIAVDLNRGAAVALGFECPLFVPVPREPRGLTMARRGEGDRAWSAGAGAGALATGLTECVWLLRQIRAHLSIEPDALLDWETFALTGRGLFIWEAFVSKAAKSTTHVGDAELGVQAFLRALPNVARATGVTCAEPYSLIGAALLRAGWPGDVGLLATPCMVIKA